jgi:hypothetical protein
MRESFVFYASFEKAFAILTDEEELQLIRAILDYALREQEPKNLTVSCRTVFELIRPQLDASCRRFDAAKKGAEHRWGKDKEENSTPPTKQEVPDSAETKSKKPAKKEIPPSPEEGKEEQEKPKPKKKRFGFWMNVYLTKEELDELSKITLYQDLISKYSEYKSRHIFKPIRDYEAILYFQKHKEVSEEMFLDENAEYW